MLNGVLAWPSCLILSWTRDADLDLVVPDRFHIRNPDLFLFYFISPEKWVMAALEIIKDVASSKGELILYFKSKFWAWVDELRAGSVHRIVIYSLRPLSKLRRTRLKLFALGGNLFELSLATYSVRFINESLEFVYDRTPRYKCKTPSSGTAYFRPFLVPAPDCPWGIVGCDVLFFGCCSANCVNISGLSLVFHRSSINRFAREFVNVS